MSDLIDRLTTPPALVDPLGAWGWIGFTLLLLVGACALVTSALADRWGIGAARFIVSGGGVVLMTFAEFRFFRAVHPEQTGGIVTLWLLLVALPVIGAIALAVLDRASLGAAGAVIAGSALAAVLASAADRFNEHLALIPLSIAALAALIGVGAVVVFGERR